MLLTQVHGISEIQILFHLQKLETLSLGRDSVFIEVIALQILYSLSYQVSLISVYIRLASCSDTDERWYGQPLTNVDLAC